MRITRRQIRRIVKEAVTEQPPYVLERSGVGYDERFFVEVITGGRQDKIVYGSFDEAQQFSTDTEAEKMQDLIDEIDGFWVRIKAVRFFEDDVPFKDHY